jgi:serine/threonine protein kinase
MSAETTADGDTAPSSTTEQGVVLAPGAIIGQYELIRELGRGGMGVVFAARDTRLGRRVAIKFVLHATGEIAQRFMIEAKALARCEHPNIVVIHAVDEHEGLPYLVLEFLEGHSLRDLMLAAPRLPATRAVELMLPVARALARAHELEIIHRDLKPENVFVTTTGQIKVLDFGIAKSLDDDRASAPRLTAKHSLLGTLTYMSPEQMGTDSVDARSDVWALGIIMFEMLAGHHPIDPPTTERLITNAVTDDPMPSLAAARRDIPPALARAVDACLVKDKTKRLSSAELVQVLEALAPGRRARTLGDNESPYPGLAAFQETDAGRFFGRESEITRMVARVREQPLSGVIGPSGAGKSSFVRAGVGPALKASGERWEIATVRPGRNPIVALAMLVQRVTASVDKDAPTQSSQRDQLVRRLRTEPGTLGSVLRAHARKHDQNVMLFVDQLEELFTLVADPTERQAFTAALLGAADDPSAPLRVVVSIRSDFVDRLVEHSAFVEELSRGILLLSTPDRAGLRDALEQPLALDGYAFESQDIVDDMLAALEGVSGALPLLQFAAAKLWDGRDSQHKLITNAGYRAIGGLSGALATHADDVLAKLDTNAQKLARTILRALVTPERTRAIVEIDDLFGLSDRSEVARVIDQLVTARLVVVQKRAGGGGTAELVHESLIERWPTLRRWLDEEQDDAAFLSQIAAAAKQWEGRSRSAELVWHGDLADELRRWLALRPRELPARDRAFADAVLANRARGARRRRRMLIASFALLGAIAAGAIIAVIQVNAARQDAERNEMMAARNAALADRNAALWREAASALDAKDREKRSAEARSADAEREKDDATSRAEREKQDAEREREAAQHEKLEAQSAIKEKESQVVESREALQAKNKLLEQALRDQRAATERAERATSDAQKAQADAQRAVADAERAKVELQKALDIQKKRADALAEERRKLSTELKE